MKTKIRNSVFIGLCSLGGVISLAAQGAERAELSLTKPAAGENVMPAQAQINSMVGLETGSSLKELSKIVRRDGSVHYRFQQSFKGVPVYGDHVIITTTKAGAPVYLAGSVVKGMAADLGDSQKDVISEEAALASAQTDFSSSAGNPGIHFTDEKVSLYVDMDAEGKAVYIYEVTFFVVVEGHPTKPVYILDAATGKILRKHEGLNTATAQGPGGNQRMGRIDYGQNGFPELEITKSGTSCYLENSKVRVVDMGRSESEATSPAVSYYCGTDNYHAEYQDNGSFGYNNDALFGGTSFVDMLSAWYGEAALPFKLIQRTNFSTNYANAYWDGSKMTYGNGGTDFHHMDAFGVAGHEIAHGYTQFHSNLAYYNQSGGMNESFSDMAGEVLKFYILGQNDFLVGSLLKKYSGYMRNMKNPPADGYSIDHVNRYYSGIDVHHSSGVYNKAFYLLATTSGWDTRKAFEVFLIANRDYWRPNDTYQSAGTGVCQAVNLLGYDGSAVKAALNAVGVTPSNCGSAPVNPVEIANGETLTISGAEKANLRYFINVPSGVTSLTVSTNGNNGDADLYLKHNANPTDSDYDCGSLGPTSVESCTVSNPQAGEWRILVHAWAAINNITLTASYEGGSTGGQNADVAVELIGATGKAQKTPEGEGYVKYKAVVTNGGPGTAENVVLSNIFPQGVTLRSITSPQGACSADGKSCDLGSISVNSTVEVIIEVGVTDTKAKQFGATVTTSSTDSNQDNNLDAEKFGGALGYILLALAGLALRRRFI